MATIKSHTSLEQSKVLVKILPIESADMRYGYIAPYEYSDRMYDGGFDEIPYPKDFLIKNPNFSANEYDAELPCWSLSALLNILSKQDFIIKSLERNNEYQYNINIPSRHCKIWFSSLLDAVFEMICWLKENNKL